MKDLLNRLTAEGANALLDDAVRAALLERMSEVPLDDPRADIAGVDPPEDEELLLAGMRTERANMGPLVTPTTRMQGLVDLSQRVCYGPLNRPEFLFDAADADANGFAGDVVVGGLWYKSQRPMKGVSLPSPNPPSWACSTACNALLSTWLNAGPKFRRGNGAEITAALERPSELGGFREYVSPLYEAKPVSWEHLLEHDDPMGDVNVVRIGFYSQKKRAWKGPSHVVLVLRCGPGHLELRDPETGEPCIGLYRFGADGSYADVPSYEAVRDDEPGAYRAYSCRRTTFRPVDPDDNGRAYVHRVVQLHPDGHTPWMARGVYHLNEPCGLRIRLAA